MNLSEIAPAIRHETLVPALIDSFCEHYGERVQAEILNHENLAALPGLQQRFEENASWEWRFGHAPQFQMQLNEYLSWGFVDVFMDTEHARITRVEIYSDSLFPTLIEALQKGFEGATFTKEGVREACSRARVATRDYDNEIFEFENWMLTRLEV